MKYPELRDYVQLGWTGDLKPWGLTVSLWLHPVNNACAYLYKHKESGAHYIAKTYEEQVKIHKRYGVPVVPPGMRFRDRDKKWKEVPLI